jgi:hypothetical protein
LGTVANLSLWPEKALNLCTTEGEFFLLLLLIISIISIIKLLQNSVHPIHCTNLSSYLTFLHNTAALTEKTPNFQIKKDCTTTTTTTENRRREPNWGHHHHHHHHHHPTHKTMVTRFPTNASNPIKPITSIKQ